MNLIIILVFSAAFIFQILLSKTRFSNQKVGFLIFASGFLVVFGFAAYFSYQQYLLWESDAVGKLLLSPYRSFDYFVSYVRFRFFNPYFLSLIFGIAGFIAARTLNKKYNKRFFETVEPHLLLTGMFIQGTPGWFFYFLIVSAVFLVIDSLMTAYFVYLKKSSAPRVSLYYFWLPAAIFTIIISRWLNNLPWWQAFEF